MTFPRVSILMPVRNEEAFLAAAIDSIQRQTLHDWELVVVDDGSEDGTPQILAAAARQDARIRLFANPERGLVPALNYGLGMCRATLVARMDGDDISHPIRLERQVAALEADPVLGLVASGFRHFPRTGLGIGMLAYERWQNALGSHDAVMRDLFVESPFVHPSVMFRKDIVDSVGGYRDMGWAEDYDLWLRLAAAGVRFARTGETLFFWRERPERATRTMGEYTAAAFRRCKAHHLKAGFLAGVSGITLAGAGIEGRAWRRTLMEEEIQVVRWVDVDPAKIGRTLHGVLVVSPDQVEAGEGKMLITVGTRGARDGIRRWAQYAGLREGEDFVCVT